MDGLPCADPGARAPIGASGNYMTSQAIITSQPREKILISVINVWNLLHVFLSIYNTKLVLCILIKPTFNYTILESRSLLVLLCKLSSYFVNINKHDQIFIIGPELSQIRTLVM